jgi:hypothetical protein
VCFYYKILVMCTFFKRRSSYLVFPAQMLEKALTSVLSFSVSFHDMTTGSACFRAANFFQIYRAHPVYI